jgi:hypothetical protein
MVGRGVLHSYRVCACVYPCVPCCCLQVHVIASLPCYSADNVDKQRGRGVFTRSIEVSSSQG